MSTEITTPPLKTRSKYVCCWGGWSPNSDGARANNIVWLKRFTLDAPTQIDGAAFVTGADGTGNLVIGIYRPISDTTATGAVLMASGAGSQGSAYSQTFIALSAAVNLPAGEYYLAVQTQNSTQTMVSNPVWYYPLGVTQTYTRAYDGTMIETLGAVDGEAAIGMCGAVRVL